MLDMHAEKTLHTDVVAIGQVTHKVVSIQHVTKNDGVSSQRHEYVGTEQLYADFKQRGIVVRIINIIAFFENLQFLYSHTVGPSLRLSLSPSQPLSLSPSSSLSLFLSLFLSLSLSNIIFSQNCNKTNGLLK